MGSIYVASARALSVFLGKCETCPRPIRITADGITADRAVFPCVDCSTPVKCERLYGTVNKMECDPRCMGATGPSCSCACGGENHAGAWSQPGHMLAGELEAYRAGIQRREDERQAKLTRERKQVADAFSAWKADGRETLVSDLLATDWWDGRYPNSFLADMADIVRSGKPLTERQADAAERTIQGRKDAANRAAEREATAVDVPAGRIKITGTIAAIYRVADNFSYHGGDIRKMVVDTGTYRVRGTIPTSLLDDGKGSLRAMYDDDLKGRQVTLTATLQPDGKEKGSGYFKRPTGAKFVSL
jgi:hypothetical protein